MKNWKIPLIMLVAVAGLAGCGGGANKDGESGTSARKSNYVPQEIDRIEAPEFKPGMEDQMFPFKIGNQWSYDAEISFIPANAPAPPKVKKLLRFRCTQVVRTPRGLRANLEVVMDDKVNEVQEWLLTKEGLFQTAVGYPPKPFNPPQPAFRAPLVTGAKGVWKGTGFRPDGRVGPLETESKVLEPQVVDTEEGQVTAIPIETRTRFEGGTALSTTWWTPTIGIVRYRQEAVTKEGVGLQVMRLRSKSLK